MKASRREVDEILGTVKRELTAVRAVVDGLLCRELSCTVNVTNREKACGEVDASCKVTVGTNERHHLNLSSGGICQKACRGSRSASFDKPRSRRWRKCHHRRRWPTCEEKSS